MKRNGRMIFGTIIAGTIFFTSMLRSSILAQDVTITDGPCTIRVTSEPGRRPWRKIEVDQIRIFAKVGEDTMMIRMMDSKKEEETEQDETVSFSEEKTEAVVAEDETLKGDLYVSKEELQLLLPRLDLDAFLQMEEADAIPIGTKGDKARVLQEVLISLGFLEGPADGDYGGGTADAVRRFQETHDLEVTGIADSYTVMLIQAVSNGLEDVIETSTKGYDSASEKFPEIANKTEADLEPFLGGRWHFQYDVFEEKGFIDPGIDFGSFEVESPQIDRIRGALAIKVVINRDDDTRYFVPTPAIAVETTGAYRPYVQGAVLIGDGTARLDGGKSSGKITGTTLEESGYIPLNQEALELLASGSVHTVRLLGKNTSYDMEVTYDVEKMAACMEDCRSLVEE